jgi:hypothetical protein
MITKIKFKDRWLNASKEEIELIDKIVSGCVKVHMGEYYFCDKIKNLYSLDISISKKDNPRAICPPDEDTRYVTILYIRSNISTISPSKPLGYYEPTCQAMGTLLELFYKIPECI